MTTSTKFKNYHPSKETNYCNHMFESDHPFGIVNLIPEAKALYRKMFKEEISDRDAQFICTMRQILSFPHVLDDGSCTMTETFARKTGIVIQQLENHDWFCYEILRTKRMSTKNRKGQSNQFIPIEDHFLMPLLKKLDKEMHKKISKAANDQHSEQLTHFNRKKSRLNISEYVGTLGIQEITINHEAAELILSLGKDNGLVCNETVELLNQFYNKQTKKLESTMVRSITGRITYLGRSLQNIPKQDREILLSGQTSMDISSAHPSILTQITHEASSYFIQLYVDNKKEVRKLLASELKELRRWVKNEITEDLNIPYSKVSERMINKRTLKEVKIIMQALTFGATLNKAIPGCIMKRYNKEVVEELINHDFISGFKEDLESSASELDYHIYQSSINPNHLKRRIARIELELNNLGSLESRYSNASASINHINLDQRFMIMENGDRMDINTGEILESDIMLDHELADGFISTLLKERNSLIFIDRVMKRVKEFPRVRSGKSARLSYFLQAAESVVMDTVERHLEENGLEMNARFYDGFTLTQDYDERRVEQAVMDAHGLKLVFEKEQIPEFDPSAWNVAEAA